ncbi:MAG: serine hydrolase domain-containing protein [Parvularculaceae bacterium]
MRQWIILGAVALVTCIAALAAIQIDGLARVGAGYKAKVLCSEVFVAGRDQNAVLASDFDGIDPMLEKIGVTVRHKQQRVDASLLGFGRARAVYRDGYGCALANGSGLAELPESLPARAVDPWPEAKAASKRPLAGVDYDALTAALDGAFNSNDANHRALLVAVDGKIVAERYAPGFDADTAFLSWSMGKSVIATLVGAAVLKGYVDVDAPAPVAEWKEGDPRAAITWNDLLRMQSGLEFAEDYDDPLSDVNRMLFAASDAGEVAAKQPLAHAPGDVWAYSSGTTNLVARTLRATLKERGIDLYVFAREAIFDPIGATSFVLETDADGNPIGSSFVYAAARDWARLGQLYLQDSVWEGRRILPEGWTDYVSAPTPASDGQYGAHFWLNRDGDGDGNDARKRFLPGLPESVYFMAGHEGQYVFIIPSKRAVIVRTGMTREGVPIDIVAPLIGAIYDAVGNPPDAAAP